MSMPINPVETNTPLQPAPPWTDGVSAQSQLANSGQMTNYTSSGVLIPAGTTTAITKDVITNDSFEAQLVLTVKIAAVSGGETLTVTINGKTASGAIYPILQGLALNAVGVTTYRIGMGFTAVANLTANDMLPNDMQVICAISGTGAITYGADLTIG